MLIGENWNKNIPEFCYSSLQKEGGVNLYNRPEGMLGSVDEKEGNVGGVDVDLAFPKTLHIYIICGKGLIRFYISPKK